MTARGDGDGDGDGDGTLEDEDAAAPDADATSTRADGTDDDEPVLLDVSFGEPAGGRSAVGPAVGAVLIAGLAGAGVVQARRRRRDELL